MHCPDQGGDLVFVLIALRLIALRLAPLVVLRRTSRASKCANLNCAKNEQCLRRLGSNLEMLILAQGNAHGEVS